MRRLFLILLPVVILTSCFTSKSPLYEANQVVQDDRLSGIYTNLYDGKSGDRSTWTIKRSGDQGWRYDILIKDGVASIELAATLFRLDTNLWLDLYPLRDSGARHQADVPTASEIIHLAFFEAYHIAWKVEILDDQIAYYCPASGGGAEKVLKEAPELKSRRYDNWTFIVLPDSPKEAQKYLRRFADDPEVFMFKGKLMRKKEP